MQPRHAREEVDEEPRRVPEEGPLALHAAQLLQEGEREDLRVREPLEGLVAPPSRVEVGVGVVDEAEQDGYGLFRSGESVGMVFLGHLMLQNSPWPRYTYVFSGGTMLVPEKG